MLTYVKKNHSNLSLPTTRGHAVYFEHKVDVEMPRLANLSPPRP